MTQLPLYFLHEEPLAGFSPKEALAWIDTVDNETTLADAYAIVSNHVGFLMHEVCERDPWSVEVYDAWYEVDNVLMQRILALLKAENDAGVANHILSGKGTHYLVLPFMRRNGYRDGSGWWMEDDEDED